MFVKILKVNAMHFCGTLGCLSSLQPRVSGLLLPKDMACVLAEVATDLEVWRVPNSFHVTVEKTLAGGLYAVGVSAGGAGL